MSQADEHTRITNPEGAPTQSQLGEGVDTTPMRWGEHHGDDETKRHQALRIDGLEILEEIGRGGMGMVYRARQSFIDRDVAVKVLLSHLLGDDEHYRARFRREAKLLASFQHPHIVACHQAGVVDSGDCYMVMEFVQGPNLRQYVQDRGVLHEDFALELCASMAAALAHAAEQGIIHRDVKPDNILLCERGGELIPKLADLGLARPVRAEGDLQLTGQGMILGTPSTMAPEQFDDPDGIDERADMYGLGCVLFYALTGEYAFSVNTGMSQMMVDKVTGQFRNVNLLDDCARPATIALVKRLLAPKKEQRFADYQQLIAAVAECRSQTPAPVGEDEKTVRNLFLYVGLVALVVCAGVVAMVMVPQPGEKVTEPRTISQVTTTLQQTVVPDQPVRSDAVVTPSQPTEVTSVPWQLRSEQALWDRASMMPFGDKWTELAPGWGLADEIEGGIVGFSGAQKENWNIYAELPQGDWHIVMMFHPQNIPDLKNSEAGVFIQHADLSLEGMLFQDGGGLYVASQLHVSAQRERGLQAKTTVLEGAGPYALHITQTGDHVTFTIDNTILFTKTFTGGAHGLGLYVKNGAAAWSNGLIRPLPLQRDQ